MSTVPGLFVVGEANFSDHGANRLGASALMQGLADGYFILPYTLGNYLASTKQTPAPVEGADVQALRGRGARTYQAVAVDQGQTQRAVVPSATRQTDVGPVRHGPQRAEPEKSPQRDSRPPRGVLAQRQRHGRRTGTESGPGVRRPRRRLSGVRRTALSRRPRPRRIVRSALPRSSIRRPTARPERNDEQYSYVSAWEFTGVDQAPTLHKEPLEFEEVHPSVRSYK